MIRSARAQNSASEVPSKRAATKDPVFSVWLSAWVWGGGQLYNGSPSSAALWLLGQCILFLTFFYIVLNTSDCLTFLHDLFGDAYGAAIFSPFLGLLFMGVWVIQLLETYRALTRRNSGAFRGAESIAALIAGGFWMPGLSQLFNGRPAKARAYMLFSWIGGGLVVTGLLAACFWRFCDSASGRLALEAEMLAAFGGVCVYTIGVILSSQDALHDFLYPQKAFLRQAPAPWVRMLGSFWRTVRTCLLTLGFVVVLHAVFAPRLHSVGLQMAEHLTQRGYVILPEALTDALRFRE